MCIRVKRYYYPICVPRYGLHVIMYFFSFTIMESLCIIVPPVCPNILNAFIFYLLLWYHCIYYVPWYYLQVDIPSRFCPAGVVDAQKKRTIKTGDIIWTSYDNHMIFRKRKPIHTTNGKHIGKKASPNKSLSKNFQSDDKHNNILGPSYE